IKGKAMEFLIKLGADDTAPGLHIEPIRNAADRRLRTGRVDKFWRAVLFKLTGKTGTNWVIYGVYPHDDAIKLAENLKLDINPTNGVTEITLVDKIDEDELEARLEAPEAPAEPEELEEPAVAAPPAAAPPVADPVFGDKPLSETLGAVPDARLVSELGIWQRVVTKARSCKTVDGLLDSLNALGVPEWQSVELLDLASGTSFDDVAKKLFGTDETDEGNGASDIGVSATEVASGADAEPAVPSGPDTEQSEDDALIAGLKTSAAQLSFAEIDDEEELKRVAEGGDFEAWSVFLHPGQRRWAKRDYNGPFRLSGGAGTGKTVVLVHRAVRLAKAPAPTDGIEPRVVLTTFTRNLASELDAQISTLDKNVPRAGKLGNPGLYVAGVDQLAFEVLRGTTSDELLRATTELLGRPHLNITNRSGDSDW